MTTEGTFPTPRRTVPVKPAGSNAARNRAVLVGKDLCWLTTGKSAAEWAEMHAEQRARVLARAGFPIVSRDSLPAAHPPGGNAPPCPPGHPSEDLAA